MLPCAEHCGSNTHGSDVTLSELLEPNWPPFTVDDVQRSMDSLDPGKSNGPFTVTVELLLRTKTALLPVLAKLFTACCAAGYFPDTWKTAYVTPLPKLTKDPTSPSSW